MNIFNTPEKYIKEIREKIKISEPQVYGGKAMAVVFFTKICKAGCPFCFFKSNSSEQYDILEEQEMTDDAFYNFIEFINTSNIETLEISGGGEPFEKKEYINKTLESAKVDDIIIVTSSYWANSYENVVNILNSLLESISQNPHHPKVVLRLSIDKNHISRIGQDKPLNVIKAFENNFVGNTDLSLRIHSMENDDSVETLLQNVQGNVEGQSSKKYVFHTDKGLDVEVEKAKIFLSNLKVDIRHPETKKKAFDVFMKDVESSPRGNFSCYRDKSGKIGLDYLINYNGNVITWGNYQRYNAPNLYIHNPSQIREQLYTDLVSYSFIDKSFAERSGLISTFNPNAAIRSILINIRDFSGSYMLEESHTELLYALIVVKEYLKGGKISEEALDKLSPELKNALTKSNSSLIDIYKDSQYNIFEQLKAKTFDKDEWRDMFELCYLGHYDTDLIDLEDAISYYNSKCDEPLNTSEFKFIDTEQQKRLLNKLSPMNSEAKEKISIEKPNTSSKKNED